MPHRAFRIAYDGRAFYGFQRQPDVPTVEDAVFDALRTLDVLAPAADVPPGYAGAGRTDRGVSAVAQTMAFECPDWLSPGALNGELPADVRAWASADVPTDFHATYDCASREYVYHLHAPDADEAQARHVLDRLEGTTDFHNLTPDEGDTTRTLRTATVARDGPFLVLALRADGFLRQLVRRIATLVGDVATGERDDTAVDRVLSPDPLPGGEGIGPAPPEGLVLTDTEYPGVSFETDESAAAPTRDIFAARHVEHATNARVADVVRDGVGEP